MSKISVDLALTNQVRRDQVELLYRQSPTAILGSLFAGSVLGYLHWLWWPEVSRTLIVSWLVAGVSCTMLRFATLAAFRRACATGDFDPALWVRVYAGTLAISASVWGCGAVAVVSSTDLLSQVVTVMFAVGLAGSAIPTYTAHRQITWLGMGLALSPMSLWLLFQPQPLQKVVGLACLIFLVTASLGARRLSAALVDAFRLTHELERANRLAEAAAMTDVLTGLSNRRAFLDHAEQMLRYAVRHHRPMCAVMMDIDWFKRVNDTYGHRVGDDVLTQVAEVLRTRVRGSDICGRIGGEEFAMLLPDASVQDACRLADEVRSHVEQLNFAVPDGRSFRITASFGVSVLRPWMGEDIGILLHSADEALYQAKAGGRNRVDVALPASP
ncbi:GGDEF domain-containing protein [Aquabacterium sp.]|uniref:GGDEF domain-containing protein n=1 Tax=Aquabacterium sp. TaxID=1872578 RepID=UPI0035B3A5E0